MTRTGRLSRRIARLAGAVAAATIAAPSLAQNVEPEGPVHACNSPLIGTLDSSVGFDGTCSEILMPVTWDFYTFQGTAGQVVEFEADRTAPFFDPELAVWQGDPTGVALNSFFNPSTCSDASVTWLNTFRNEDPPAVPGPSGDPHGTVVLPATGQYFIIVASTCSAGAPHYDYILRATGVTCVASITNVNSGLTYESLQSAVNAATAGDRIEIGSGAVYENGIVIPANADLTIVGAGADQTVIDSRQGAQIMKISTGTITLEGLRFANCMPAAALDGALNIFGAATVRVTDCAFSGHETESTNAGSAANIRGTGCKGLFTRCRFENNVGNVGAVNIDLLAHADLINCVFSGNVNNRHLLRTAQEGTARLVNCTIGDCPTRNGSMIQAQLGTEITTMNCVFDGTGGPAEFGGAGAHLVTDCLYPGATAILGNVDGVPTFVDAANGDYRLAPGSLGIDAAYSDAYTVVGGSPFDFNGEPRFHDDTGTDDTGRGAQPYMDMGAYEFQGTSPVPCIGDVNGTDTVDFDDLNALLSAWGATVGTGDPLDLAGDDGLVNFDDLNVLLSHWGSNCG